MSIKDLRPTLFKSLLTIISIPIAFFAVFSWNDCNRRDCVPPELGGNCTTPIYCDYEYLLVLLVILIPITFYVGYSYMQSNRIRNKQ